MVVVSSMYLLLETINNDTTENHSSRGLFGI